jgi:chromatin remodeling complex protein RSC6
MADLKIQQQKINKCLDDIIDSSKTRTLKLNEEKIIIKKLVKEINTFKKQTKCKKKNKTKVHLKQYVSPEIYKFMGINNIIKLSKTDVMQYICNYIKDKGLQNADNKRYFITNKELSKLFKVKYKTYMSTIEIMKYIHPHFEKENVIQIKNYIPQSVNELYVNIINNLQNNKQNNE